MNLSRWPTKQTVLCHTKSGRTFRGILWCKRGPLLVLHNAEILDGAGVLPVDGDVFVERDNVDFLQTQPHGDPS